MNQDRELIRKRAESLVNARIAAGFGTAHAAAKAGNIVQTTYSSYERGKTPFVHRVSEFSKLFNVPVEDLLSGSVKPPQVIEIKLSVQIIAKPDPHGNFGKLQFLIKSIDTVG